MHRGRIRAFAVSATVAVVAVLGLATAGPAEAACASTRDAISTVDLTPTGTSSQAQTSSHTVIATVTAGGGANSRGPTPVAGVCVSFEQRSGPSAGWPRFATTASDGTASITYTSAAAGQDVLYALAYGAQTVQSAYDVTHTWTAPPPPSSPPPSSSSPPASPPPG
ncbi:MAG: hypothetical protein JWP11_1601, partial [Frankiales bacterium]|nr:hypothetical protein [Frankiales bacterium]